MKAIVKPKPVEGQLWPVGLQLVDKPEPAIEQSNDVIIKVAAGAICGTDVGIYNSKESLRAQMMRARSNPVTIGHEFSGRIVDAGKEARKHLARLVVNKAKTDPLLKKLLQKKSAATLASEKKFMTLLEKEFFSTAEMHITCGTCYQCRQGEYHVCRNTIINGVHDDGAWASYVKVPAQNVRLFFRREIPYEIISFMDALGNATHTVMAAPIKG